MASSGRLPVPNTSRYRVNSGVATLQNASLSAKIARFTENTNKHKESQERYPFAQEGGAAKKSFNKDEYGKPVKGSLTEFRGQKANLQISNEVLELCLIIDSEGMELEDDPGVKVILFGDLFQIYTHISNKVVGILLRARKHNLVHFEGEILFQRRDDDVPIFLLKPIQEIRKIVGSKQEEVASSMSSNPRPTTVLQDNLK